ncbi:MAG TPA: DNA polymerase III subunit gamma/tau [Blastocatellia bacterium]|nr:DNA polymerase III subunit gamma/tau [Blastocatellia bacterium]
MSDSHVIARKFRPQTFEQVVGQEAITRTLSNAIKSGRLHHAYIFSGARGVGKTTTARILAKALNCVNGPTTEPCGVCQACEDITKSKPSYVLEIDAASNTGVDNVRNVIIESASIAPPPGRHKIFIIDEVHMLSNAAFNALLKTLEEPPPRVMFILATTELQKVPETILSRCQVFEFRTITVKKIADQLRHIAADLKIDITEAAILAIARAGEGSMRDAESAFDQVISFSESKITEEDVSAALGLVDLETLNKTLGAIAAEDSGQVLRIIEDVVTRGYDLRNFCRELMIHVRALLVTKIAGFDAELLQVPQSEADSLVRLADSFSEQDLLRFFANLTKTEQDIRLSSQPRFQLEIGLMKLLQARRLYLLEDALEQIKALQSRLPGSPPSGQAPVQKASPPRSESRGPKPARRNTEASEPTASYKTEQSGLEPAKQARERVASPVPQMTDEPPPPPDEPYEIEYETPQAASQQESVDGDAGLKIKDAVEQRGKKFLRATLDQAESIKVDGQFLLVSFSPEKGGYKKQVEGRDNRKILEEVGREIAGRQLTLSVAVGGQAAQAAQEVKPEREQRAEAKERAEDHPAVRAIVDKFHGEVVEVRKPKNQA